MIGAASIARLALFAIALLWPLEIAATVPGLSYTFTALAAAVLILATFVYARRAGKLAVPFEFWWPAAALAAVCMAFAYVSGAFPLVRALECTGAVAVFICVSHWIQREATVRACIILSCIGGAIAILAVPAAAVFQWMPTTYASRWGIEFPFAFNVFSGFQVALLTAALGFGLSADRTRNPGLRAAGTLLFLAAVVLVVAKGIQGLRGENATWTSGIDDWSPWEWLGTALALWLVVRVLAKLNVCARRDSPSFWGYGVALGIAVLIVLAIRLPEPRLYHGFLLGMLAGASLIRRSEDGQSLHPSAYGAAAFAAIALAGFHGTAGLTSHADDERHYEHVAEAEFNAGAHDALLRRLERIAEYWPEEPGVFYWRARVALDRDDAEKAAVADGRAVLRHDAPRLASGPAKEQFDEFLVRMRDRIAHEVRPEHSPAYVRMLAARDEMTAMLAYVQAQAGQELYEAWTAPAAPFAQAVAAIVGGEATPEDFAAMSAAQLRRILSNWGAAEHGDADVAEPLILVAQRWASSAELRVFGTVQDAPFQETRACSWSRKSDRFESRWTFDASPAEGQWEAALWSGGSEAARLATVTATADGRIRLHWEPRAPERLSYRPAILVILPEGG